MGNSQPQGAAEPPILPADGHVEGPGHQIPAQHVGPPSLPSVGPLPHQGPINAPPPAPNNQPTHTQNEGPGIAQMRTVIR